MKKILTLAIPLAFLFSCSHDAMQIFETADNQVQLMEFSMDNGAIFAASDISLQLVTRFVGHSSETGSRMYYNYIIATFTVSGTPPDLWNNPLIVEARMNIHYDPGQGGWPDDVDMPDFCEGFDFQNPPSTCDLEYFIFSFGEEEFISTSFDGNGCRVWFPGTMWVVN